MSTPLLVDTDVVSFLFKGHSLSRPYAADLAGHTLVVSFMTLAELDQWALRSGWGQQRVAWLQSYLEPFVVLPYDRRLCHIWAHVMVTARAKGCRIETSDAWIAATALLYGLTLVTHNRADYLGVPNLKVLSHAQ